VWLKQPDEGVKDYKVQEQEDQDYDRPLLYMEMVEKEEK